MNTRKEWKPLVVQNENADDQKEKEKATFALLWKLMSADCFIILDSFLSLSPLSWSEMEIHNHGWQYCIHTAMNQRERSSVCEHACAHAHSRLYVFFYLYECFACSYVCASRA